MIVPNNNWLEIVIIQPINQIERNGVEMRLNKAMMKAIELTIEEFKRYCREENTRFICYAINSVLYNTRDHMEFELIAALQNLKLYIQEGLAGHSTLGAWIDEEVPPDANFALDDMRDDARLCWLERLVYFREQGAEIVSDNGKSFVWYDAQDRKCSLVKDAR